MRPRFEAFLAHAEDLLAGMASEQLAAISRHPAGDRMNRRCLLHTVEHLGLHLGHIEVTIDWYRADDRANYSIASAGHVTRSVNLSSGKVKQRARLAWHHDGDTSAQARPRMRVA